MKNWKKQIALAVTAGLLTVMGAATAFAASKTRLDTVTDLYWGDDGTTANWEKIDDAYQYEVRLYCNESQVESIKTKKDSFDMEKKMTKEGDYTFRVRALAKSNSKEFTDGYWSEDSEETYVSADFADMIKNGGSTSQLKNGGPGKKEDGSAAEEKEASIVRQAKWIQEDGSGRWWYQNADGSYPKGGWWQEPATGTWYFFDAQGYMQTGWIDWNGSRYYCTGSGAMAVGEYTIDGAAYRFDASGALKQ